MKPEKRSNWQDLLSRWLSGRITAREEQDLDRLAQDDPFLADALEGYRQYPESDHAARIADLKQRFEQKRAKRGFPVWRIAAAVAFLLIAGFALQQINRPAGEAVAQMENAAEQSPPPPREEAAEQAAEPVEIEAEETPLVVNDRQRAKSITPPPVTAERTQPQPPTSAPPAETRARTMAPAAQTPVVTNPAREPAPKNYEEVIAEREEPLPAAGEARTADTALAGRAPTPAAVYPAPYTDNLYYAQTEITDTRRRRTKQVDGVITDPAGEPLIGATIAIPGANKSTVTNIDGQFSLIIPAETEQLQVAYLNDTRNFRIGARDSFSLESEHMALDEVVITGYAKQNRRQAANQAPTAYQVKPAVAPLPARPSIDSTAYRRYIRESLRYPDEARQANISGTVRVQFAIDPAGKPYDFQILQSLGYGCDAEAIRLIREGPAWIPGDRSVATYSISFDP